MRSTRAAGLLGLIGFFCLTSCINPNIHREALAANGVLREQLAAALDANQTYQNQVNQLQTEVGRMAPLVKDAAYLKKQKALVDSILRRFNTEGGPTLPKGVQPVSVKDGLALRVEGKILFASGSDELASGGQKTLRELVEPIRSHPGLVRVSGHTDNDPIRRSSWKTNMRLSVARALVVREYLVSQGLPAAKMSVVGYGEFQPVDVNDKSKNRRTEIVLLR